MVVKGLFEKYPNVAALADAPVEDIEAIVKPCGLGHSKARDISACMKVLRDEYGGHVPDDFNALLKLPESAERVPTSLWGCVWKTGDRHGYALHPPGKPDRAGGRNQGPEARGNGTLEADSTGGGQRFLPPPGVSRA